MEGKSLDITEEKRNLLKKILPEAFTEGKIDWEKLKATLGDDIEFKNERYVLNWAGKSEAFRVLQSPTTATLVPCEEESVSFDDTENIFIEGENLEVLKVLQKSYFGKIKMIYIDPPYNTGNDKFIYPDKFSETKEVYLSRVGDKDETGYMTREGLFRTNSKDSGHYHSNWLSMMYPRLFLARNLLRDDGVIFISIDDNEIHNLRLIMDEIFGEENFIEQFVWKKSYGGGAKEKYAVTQHEYILMYTKNLDSLHHLWLPPDPETEKRYYKYKDDNFERFGPYRLNPLEASASMDERPKLRFSIIHPVTKEEVWPKKQWWWKKERVEISLEKGLLVFSGNTGKYTVNYKQYLKDEKGDVRRAKPFSIIDKIYTQSGTKDLRDLFEGEVLIQFPKPVGLINKLIEIGTISKDDIILDFFAGSCTTAHTVLKMNKEEGSKRKFIMVQLPEICDENSEAFNAGYKTIAEIAKERIRRIIRKIKSNKQSRLDIGDNAIEQELGFKVFKLQQSNFKIWRSDVKTEEELYTQLTMHTDPVDENAKIKNILYELLLKSGVPLTARIEEKGGYYQVNDGEIALILKNIDESIIEAAISERPQKVITLDRLFENNDQLKTNTALQMKDAEIDFRVV